MLLLENVSRSASGTYVCQSFDFESDFDAEDSVNITVHCKSMFFCRSCAMVDVGEMMSAFIFMVTNTFFFFFLDLDQIMVTPKEKVLNQGEDLPLTCNALSSLPTLTAWYKVQQ